MTLMQIPWRRVFAQLLSGFLLLAFYCAGYFTCYFESKLKVEQLESVVMHLDKETLRQDAEIDSLKKRAAVHTAGVEALKELARHVEKIERKLSVLEAK